jgi:hypothetical protein
MRVVKVLNKGAHVYRDELYKCGHGYPLYAPKDEAHPGDIGFFNEEGGFTRLFNCTVPANHPINLDHLGSPPDFQPLLFGRHHIMHRDNHPPAQIPISYGSSFEIDVNAGVKIPTLVIFK